MPRTFLPLVVVSMLAPVGADESIAPQLVDGPIAWTYSVANCRCSCLPVRPTMEGTDE